MKDVNSKENNQITSNEPNIYHEKQIKELCALHALNNLFQERNSFTKSQLDSICTTLSPNVWINPHRSMLGFGNYDINVIMKALQMKGCEAVWFDKRRDPDFLNIKNIFGFILNIPTEYKFGFVMLPLRRRHWIAVKEINGNFYNLDSKLDKPQLIGKETELISFLRDELKCKDKELFLVVEKHVDENQDWVLPESYYNHINYIDCDPDDRGANCVTLSQLSEFDNSIHSSNST